MATRAIPIIVKRSIGVSAYLSILFSEYNEELGLYDIDFDGVVEICVCLTDDFANIVFWFFKGGGNELVVINGDGWEFIEFAFVSVAFVDINAISNKMKNDTNSFIV